MNPFSQKARTLLIGLLLTAGSITGNGSLVMANAFIDVAPSHRYYHSIETLSAEGVIQGFPVGTFLPDRPVNRVEALKIILESFPQDTELPDNESEEVEPIFTFTDTEPDTWYSPYIEQAIALNIVRGYDDGTFRPNATINLAEALKIILEIVDSENDIDHIDLETDPAWDVPKDSWFARYVQYGLDMGMLYLDMDANIHPENHLTRGQVTDLIFRIKNAYYTGEVTYGNATYYADKFNEKGTASGEKFDQTKFTAAHRTLPFGTRLRVTNQRTGASTEVTVNDRGPYSNHAIIDLSKIAFETIGHLGSGVIPVEIEVIYNAQTP